MAVNQAARQFIAALTDLVHAYEAGSAAGIAECRQALLAARSAFDDRYAEAQMVVPDAILDSIGGFNRPMRGVFGQLMRLCDDRARNGDSIESVRAHVLQQWDVVRHMRTTMRRDLGIAKVEPVPEA